jgi:hypothetical protein
LRLKYLCGYPQDSFRYSRINFVPSVVDRSAHFFGRHFFWRVLTRPTIKAGAPHVIASDEILHKMLTLRIHLDEVTDENGPLRVVPGSHVDSDSVGVGVADTANLDSRS